MEAWSATATPEQREQAAKITSHQEVDKSRAMTIEDVREIVANPTQNFLASEISLLAPTFFSMRLLILEAPQGKIFLTSDRPCVWYDPELYKEPDPVHSPGLGSPTIEITLPLAPDLLALIQHIGPEGYIKLNHKQHIVDALNVRTRVFSDEYIVVNRSSVDLAWFR